MCVFLSLIQENSDIRNMFFKRNCPINEFLDKINLLKYQKTISLVARTLFYYSSFYCVISSPDVTPCG